MTANGKKNRKQSSAVKQFKLLWLLDNSTDEQASLQNLWAENVTYFLITGPQTVRSETRPE